eukprot:scaffold7028_cov243-Pinguiococcus_pyrenoidosus.AAC.3
MADDHHSKRHEQVVLAWRTHRLGEGCKCAGDQADACEGLEVQALHPVASRVVKFAKQDGRTEAREEERQGSRDALRAEVEEPILHGRQLFLLRRIAKEAPESPPDRIREAVCQRPKVLSGAGWGIRS